MHTPRPRPKASASGHRITGWLLGIALILSPAVAAAGYTLFESDPVRPIALSPCGTYVAAANAPDGTVELLRTTRRGLRSLGRIPVGVEPVALAWQDRHTLWVVNHLSDSVSVIELDRRPLARRWGAPGEVVRTLLVGDEPRDIVFARGRAFITTAHRGQNTGVDPQLTTPGLGRADVWVFDAADPGAGLGGAPEAVLTLFTDTPRALAVSPDGDTVYAAGFRTGNRTTTVIDIVTQQGGGRPGPLTDAAGAPQLPTGLIVQHDGTGWRSTDGRSWDAVVKFDLPDLDVFSIDATTDPPTVRADGAFAGVGTVLFNMAVDPRDGAVLVTNTEANNLTRFEGEGARGGTMRGTAHQARVTVLDPATGAVTPRHLNPHIDYAACCEPLPNATNAASLSTPTAVAVTADGETTYVAGFGSSALGVYATDDLRDGTFQPDPAHQIAVSGGGPSGIALDERRGRAYVTTRFDNGISIIDLDDGIETGKVWLANPEPEAIQTGRRFLYDARLTSSNGEASCAGCHVFGDMDHLAWDLGDPDLVLAHNPNPQIPLPFPPPFPFQSDFQALKGPMMTQSLRGMDNHGPMHWRGDRTGAYAEASAQPDAGAFDERAAFNQFNGAFVSLLGRAEPLTAEQMDAFADFALALMYPPNPIANLDGSDTPLQALGRSIYFEDRVVDSVTNCNGCHTLDPDGNAAHGVERPGFFGTDGRTSFDGIPQVMKIPHMRNAYQKVGMFGMPPVFDAIGPFIIPLQANHGQHLGPQIRGFGFTHDGAIDTLFRFFSIRQFAPRAPGTIGPLDTGNQGLALDPANPVPGVTERVALEAFVLAFPNNLAPAVGQQVTLRRGADADERAAVEARVALLQAQAEAEACDLVAVAEVWGRTRSALYIGDGRFALQRRGQLTTAQALRLAPVTFTCAPPGEGDRYAFGRLD